MLDALKKRAFRMAVRIAFSSEDFATNVNSAIFYSGRTHLKGHKDPLENWIIAETFCDQNPQYQTIQRTAGGGKLKQLLLAGSLPQTIKTRLWNYASREFAQRAKGTVTIFAEGALADGTFCLVEANELINNPNVTQIHLMRSRGEDKSYEMEIITKEMLQKYVISGSLTKDHPLFSRAEESLVRMVLEGDDICTPQRRERPAPHNDPILKAA